jgi:phosphoribosyl 1,2-cyclic phosphate phosphodiesterase|tara:strand:- start:88 stop:858 length:771 start_codon:yes stop_codon:yes gene_type:complete
LKNRFTILGCGSSLGSPWINQKWGNCNKKNKKNFRTRCCAHLQYKNISILIDTSPDIRQQLISNNIKDVDAIIYTHEHADQTAGIFEFRPIYFSKQKRIPIYCNQKTKKRLLSSFPWLFKSSKLYPQIMKIENTNQNFVIQKDRNKIRFKSLNVIHGPVKTRGYLFKKIAYISDCKIIPKNTLKKLKNLEVLIIDCFRKASHKTHLDLNSSIELIKILKPKKTILINMHNDLDYDYLKNNLPKNIIPAYDGLSFNF